MTKILLVEDDKSLSEIYSVRLRAEGYDILSASDGEQALALAIKEVPDLIISDVMMPNISGFDMLDILRSTTETRGIHVIMMTALSSDEQRQRGMALGADRYLVKSQVGIEDVVRTVHEVLGDASVPADTPVPLVNEPKRATIEPGPSARATEPAPANNSPEKAESDSTKANELNPSSETPGGPASSSNPAASSTAPTPANPAPTDTVAATVTTVPASTTAATPPTAPQLPHRTKLQQLARLPPSLISQSLLRLIQCSAKLHPQLLCRRQLARQLHRELAPCRNQSRRFQLTGQVRQAE